MEDPCENTVINNPTTYDMAVSVFGPLDEAEMKQGTDSISLLHGDMLGYTYCGSRLFSIVSVTPASPVYTDFLSIDTSSG